MILIEKRKKQIEETGENPGELRDIELLKRYKYKFEEETIPKVVKKDEVIDTNFVKDAILYNKKMLYKNTIPKIAYSLFLLILFPISFILIIIEKIHLVRQFLNIIIHIMN